MGSALMGSLQIYFLTDFLSTLAFSFRKVPGRTFVSNLSKFTTFAAASISVDPIRRQPRYRAHGRACGGAATAGVSRRQAGHAGAAVGRSRMPEKWEVLLRGVGTLRHFFLMVLTIHTKKWFLGAGFLGEPPTSLRT